MSIFKRRFRYALRLVIFALAAFVLMIWVVGGYAGYRGVDELLYPQRNVYCCETPEDVGVAYETLTLNTEDGLAIKGWYLSPNSDAGIIMAHGASGNRVSHVSLALRLVEAGYGIVLLDLRGHGESEGSVFTQGWLDIRAAANYLNARGVESIGVYGFSLGANMVIQEAAESILIDAVVVDGASPVRLADYQFPATPLAFLYVAYDLVYWWQLDARSAAGGGFALRPAYEAVGKIAPRPLFLIAAGAESSGFEANTARSLYDVYSAEGGSGELWIIEDAYHGNGFAQNEAAYSTLVRSFFDEALQFSE